MFISNRNLEERAVLSHDKYGEKSHSMEELIFLFKIRRPFVFRCFFILPFAVSCNKLKMVEKYRTAGMPPPLFVACAGYTGIPPLFVLLAFGELFFFLTTIPHHNVPHNESILLI